MLKKWLCGLQIYSLGEMEGEIDADKLGESDGLRDGLKEAEILADNDGLKDGLKDGETGPPVIAGL